MIVRLCQFCRAVLPANFFTDPLNFGEGLRVDIIGKNGVRPDICPGCRQAFEETLGAMANNLAGDFPRKKCGPESS